MLVKLIVLEQATEKMLREFCLRDFNPLNHPDDDHYMIETCCSRPDKTFYCITNIYCDACCILNILIILNIMIFAITTLPSLAALRK